MLTTGLSWAALPPLQTTASTHACETFPGTLFYVLKAHCVCWALRNSKEECILEPARSLYCISWVTCMSFDFPLSSSHSLPLDDIGVSFKVHARPLPLRGWTVHQQYWHHLGACYKWKKKLGGGPLHAYWTAVCILPRSPGGSCAHWSWEALSLSRLAQPRLHHGITWVWRGSFQNPPGPGGCQPQKAGHDGLVIVSVMVLAGLIIVLGLVHCCQLWKHWEWAWGLICWHEKPSTLLKGRATCCHSETVVWRAQRGSLVRQTPAVGSAQGGMDKLADLSYDACSHLWSPM